MGIGSLISAGTGLASAASGGKGGDGGGSTAPAGVDPAMAQWQHQQDLNKIRSRYADLGLGGSTMESMDEAGAGLGFLAEMSQLQNQAQQLANQTLQTQSNVANQTLTAQTGALGSLTNLANQATAQQGFGAGAANPTAPVPQ